MAVTCRAPIVAALFLIAAPAVARAQVAPPVFFVGGLTDAKTRATAEVGVLVPFQVDDRGTKGEWGQNGKFVDCVCLEALAGWGLAAPDSRSDLRLKMGRSRSSRSAQTLS